MSKIKVKMLTSMSGKKVNHVPGDIVELDEDTATRFVDKGLAECVKPKDRERLVLKASNDLAAKLEKEAQIKAIAQKESLQAELDDSYMTTIMREFALNGVIPDEKEIQEALEGITKRDAIISDEVRSILDSKDDLEKREAKLSEDLESLKKAQETFAKTSKEEKAK